MTQHHEKFQEIYNRFLAELEEAGITLKIVLQASCDVPLSGQRKRSGHVYFIQAESGLCKIGKAKDIRSRFKGLQAASPTMLKLIYSIYFEDQDKLRAAEKALHGKFASKRKHGEWFDLDEIDVAWIREWDGETIDEY